MFDLTGFQRDLLYVIADLGESSGQKIKERLGKYKDTTINHGRLYPNLDTLVDNGLVEKGMIDRRTNFYRITDKGQQLIANRREWENQRLEDSELDLDTQQTQRTTTIAD